MTFSDFRNTFRSLGFLQNIIKLFYYSIFWRRLLQKRIVCTEWYIYISIVLIRIECVHQTVIWEINQKDNQDRTIQMLFPLSIISYTVYIFMNGFLLVKLKSSLRNFYGPHRDLVDIYGICMSQMTKDMLYLPQTLPGPFPIQWLINRFVTKLTWRAPLVEGFLVGFVSVDL